METSEILSRPTRIALMPTIMITEVPTIQVDGMEATLGITIGITAITLDFLGKITEETAKGISLSTGATPPALSRTMTGIITEIDTDTTGTIDFTEAVVDTEMTTETVIQIESTIATEEEDTEDENMHCAGNCCAQSCFE